MFNGGPTGPKSGSSDGGSKDAIISIWIKRQYVQEAYAHIMQLPSRETKSYYSYVLSQIAVLNNFAEAYLNCCFVVRKYFTHKSTLV